MEMKNVLNLIFLGIMGYKVWNKVKGDLNKLQDWEYKITDIFFNTGAFTHQFHFFTIVVFHTIFFCFSVTFILSIRYRVHLVKVYSSFT